MTNRLLLIFRSIIGCDLPTALDITKRLEAEEFIVNTAKTRSGRSKRKATVPIRYRAVKDEKNRLNMEKQYFDPLAKISHHVGVQFGPSGKSLTMCSLLQFDNLETALEIQNPESIALDSLGKAYVRSTSPIIGDSISVIPRSLVLNNNSRVSSVKNYKESSSRTKLKSYQAIQKELTQLCIPESQEGPAELAKSGAAEVEDKDQMDLDLDLDEVVMESQKGNTIEKNADCSKPSSQADDASPVDPRDRSVWFAHVGIVVENLFVPAIP